MELHAGLFAVGSSHDLGAFFSKENTFLLFYPCILSGMTAIILITYEEKEKWNEYAMTLPFSKAQLISSKYILSLLLSIATVSVICLVQILRSSPQEILGTLFTTIPMAIIPTALLLPFIYKFGPEKGRLAYYMVLGGIFGIMTFFARDPAMAGVIFSLIGSVSAGAGVVIASAAAFVLSWWLSIQFYQMRIF